MFAALTCAGLVCEQNNKKYTQFYYIRVIDIVRFCVSKTI